MCWDFAAQTTQTTAIRMGMDETMELFMKNRPQTFATTVRFGIVVLTSGFLLLAGCGDGEEKNDRQASISNIDFRLRGFEGGRVGGDFRCRAEELGSETPNVRIDKIDAEDVLIFNGDREEYYAYTGTTWLELPYSEGANYSGLAEWAAQVAQKGAGTYEREYKGRWRVTLEVRAVNPSFAPGLFSLPEDAEPRRLD